jgi:phage regulator Rha-like protein
VHSKKYITVECKDKSQKLKIDEYTRWLCLIEALDFISRKALQFKVNLHDKDVDWVKPLAFQKYIVERFDSMKDEIITNETSGKSIQTCTTLSEQVLA